MIDALLSILAPHHCYGCQKPPSLLCPECDNYNNKNYNNVDQISLLVDKNIYYVKYVAMREGVIKSLIDGYKFQREKSSYKILSKILYSNFPAKEGSVVITIPTNRSHIRERGYDHMKLIAKSYARLSGVPFVELLEGQRKFSQHQKNLKDRQNLSRGVFSVKYDLNVTPSTPIVLVDDIYTTGNTLKEALLTLQVAGFDNIECRVLVRQPFDID